MPPDSREIGPWEEWARRVLADIDRLNTNDEKLDAKVDDLREKMTNLINLKIEGVNTKLDTINNRVTNLYIKVAGIGAVSAILTTLVFSLLSAALKGKG